MTEKSKVALQQINPSDAVPWKFCRRRVWLDKQSTSDELLHISELNQLIVELGLQHEQRILEQLASSKQVVEAQSVEHTQTLMGEKTEVIYQGQLLSPDESILGMPDFLVLTPKGEYQPVDAKLSLDGQKEEIKVQLGVYRQLLQTELPGVVILGNGDQVEIGDEARASSNKFIEDMGILLQSTEMPDVRYSHSRCKSCPYYSHCRPIFERKGDLSMVYGIQGRAADGLEANGVSNIKTLAEMSASQLPDVPYLKKKEKKARAILQAQSYLSGEAIQCQAIRLPEGTWCHFDIEDNPLTGTGGKHVYLWGFLLPPYSKENYEAVWTDSEEKDEEGWLAFLALIERYRQAYPDLILAHYSNHERATIKHYAERYAMTENDTVCYLLDENGPLFDLQKPILDNLVLPLLGYGLKDICKHKELVNFQWDDDDSGSEWSIVLFNRFLSEGDPETKRNMKKSILQYNQDDVVATRRLEEWLRQTFKMESI
jgi:predicted RecB family nuclease